MTIPSMESERIIIKCSLQQIGQAGQSYFPELNQFPFEECVVENQIQEQFLGNLSIVISEERDYDPLTGQAVTSKWVCMDQFESSTALVCFHF